nr:MAG TPA: hypothetical protein [Caudoviricetes sp.]
MLFFKGATAECGSVRDIVNLLKNKQLHNLRTVCYLA